MLIYVLMITTKNWVEKSKAGMKNISKGNAHDITDT